jgi:hypothetical protein
VRRFRRTIVSFFFSNSHPPLTRILTGAIERHVRPDYQTCVKHSNSRLHSSIRSGGNFIFILYTLSNYQATVPCLSTQYTNTIPDYTVSLHVAVQMYFAAYIIYIQVRLRRGKSIVMCACQRKKLRIWT